MIWRIFTGFAAGLFLAWTILVILLLLARPKGSLLKEALRVLPDILRLLRRLARDRSLPPGIRIRLWMLFVYLASPIDLIPDFIPVIGYADDAIITSIVLRSIIRRSGPEVIRRQWPGTDEGLAALWRITKLSERSND